MFAVAGTALIALAGCGGGGGSSGTQPTAAAPTQDTHQALLQAAQCMRANGYPNWPDPVPNENGDWAFPDSAPDVPQPPAACESLMRSGKGGRGPSRPALSSNQIAQARKWSECMRQHDLPSWPDPDSDGVIDPPANLQPVDTNSQVLAAVKACQSVEPEGGPRLKPQRAEPGSTKPAGG